MNQQLQPTPKIVRAGGGECLALRGETRYQLLAGHDTGGALALALSKFEKGSGAPLHVHTREDEWFCVESGQFRFQIGESTQTLEAGDLVFAPRGVAHRYECESESGELLIGVVEAGFENFFRELAAQGPQSPTSIREITATYGVFFDGFDSLETAPLSPQILRVGQGEYLEAFGDRAHILVSSRDSGGGFCLAESETPSFCGPPPHLHEREDEVFVIRAGRYEFQIGDARVQAESGDVVFAPRGVPHTFRVVSDQAGRFLLFTTPGGFDLFFAECAHLFQSGEATPEAIGQIATTHGLSFLPPIS